MPHRMTLGNGVADYLTTQRERCGRHRWRPYSVYCLLDALGKEAVADEEGANGGIGASEAAVEGHGVLGTATGEDVLLKALCGFGIEDALVEELLEGIGLDHLGPLVTIITGGIAS